MTSDIEHEFRARHAESRQLAERATTLFPEGTTHPARRLRPFPVYMARSRGARQWDVDDNEFIDFHNAHGAMLLGHAHPAVVEAVQRQMAGGSHLSASTRLEVEWATLVKRMVPSIERVRFTSSGSEAVMLAFRLARKHTRRQVVVKFQGAFHGWSDPAYAGDDATNAREGIAHSINDSVLCVAGADLAALEVLLMQRGDIAAIILQTNAIVSPQYMADLRELTRRHDILLIFDEIVSGFRWSRAGAQGKSGVKPDLTTLGKVLAGGLPGAAVGGSAEIMDCIRPGGMCHPGTFNANPLSAAAGSAALRIVEQEPVGETAEHRAARLRAGLNGVLRRLNLKGGAYGLSSIVAVSLGIPVDTDDPFALPRSPDGSDRPLPAPLLERLHLALINQGLWCTPTAMILSTAHTDEDVDESVRRYEVALRQVLV